jgi:hypothetical protein
MGEDIHKINTNLILLTGPGLDRKLIVQGSDFDLKKFGIDPGSDQKDLKSLTLYMFHEYFADVF